MKPDRKDHAPAAATVKSADRVLDLLELLAGWQQELSHAAIANALGIPRSSLTQLLRNLVQRSYIAYDAVRQVYSLGDAVGRLASQSAQPRDLLTIAMPFVAKIVEATLESCTLTRLHGNQSEVIGGVNSPHRLVSNMRVGDRGPLYALSSGKAMLAAMPSEMLRDYLASVKFEAATPHTLGSAKALLRDIERVRLEGVGYSLEEFTLGISGMGVALLSSSGLPIGGIAISIPCVRYTPEARKRGIAALLHAARQINQLHRATVSPASARPATAAPLRKLSAATSHR